MIAGESVVVVHSEPISLRDNPLALRHEAVIILQSVHWTRARSRNGKVGVVPSNILSFEGNPIKKCWTKVHIQHSYMAKTRDQLTVDSHEKVQIYGEVDHDGMILAKCKTFSGFMFGYLRILHFSLVQMTFSCGRGSTAAF